MARELGCIDPIMITPARIFGADYTLLGRMGARTSEVEMNRLADTFVLSNGRGIPCIGLGT